MRISDWSSDVCSSDLHAEGARSLGVGLALRHLFAVEMRHLFQEMHVVQQDRAVRADRQRVTVARRGGAGAHRRAGRGLTHAILLYWISTHHEDRKSTRLNSSH